MRRQPQAFDIRRNFALLAIMVVILTAAGLPMFFDAYRAAYYSTFSYDDYSRYLLWLLDRPGGELPPSPHVYRLGAVVLAAPFYYLPLVLFSGEGIAQAPVALSAEHAKALQAMCAANAAYASLSACLAGVYLWLRRDVAPGWAFGAVLGFLLLTPYFGMSSADGIALFPLCIAVIGIAERKIEIFASAVILGTIINEKVALVAFFAVSLRLVFSTDHRRVHLAMAIITALALTAFAGTVLTLAMPGLDNQRDPSTYLAGMVRSLDTLTSSKGLYQNIWPALLLLLLWCASLAQERHDRLIQRCDVGVILGMFAFAMALDVQYNVGRIVMFAMPLFYIGAIESLGRGIEPAFRSASLRGDTTPIPTHAAQARTVTEPNHSQVAC